MHERSDSVLGRRVGGLTLLSAGAAVAAALTISVSEELRFASYSPAGYVALETAAGVIAAIAAFVAFGRFRLSGAPADLALVVALGLLSGTTLLFFTVPAIARESVGALSIWGQAVGTVMAAGAFGLAAYPGEPASGPQRRRYADLIFGYGASAVGGLVLLYVVRPAVDLPRELPTEALAEPLVVGPASLLIWHLAAAVIFAVATFGFVRRCRERGDELTFALALAMPLGSAAAVHYFLFPSPYAGYVFAGDVFRLIFFVVVLGGVLAQIGSYQRAAERLGGRRERERLVRELHDGPVQELALLQLLVDQLAERVRDPAIRQLDHRAAAALRHWRLALDEAEARAAGNGDAARPLAELVAEAVHDLTSGTGIDVAVEVDPAAELADDQVHDAVFLLREAISNAVRHAGAHALVVEVSGEDPVRLAVRDDGRGFDPNAPPRDGGRGLRTMRERAEAMDADLRIASSPAGTSVEAHVRPHRD